MKNNLDLFYANSFLNMLPELDNRFFLNSYLPYWILEVKLPIPIWLIIGRLWSFHSLRSLRYEKWVRLYVHSIRNMNLHQSMLVGRNFVLFV